MRIQILSDLHFEFQRDAGRSLMDACKADSVDVLVLAGDIAVADGIGAALALFSERYPQVIYIHGNHEYYGSDRESVLAHTREAALRLGNVHFLDCDTVELGGHRFCGSPLWFRRTADAHRLRHQLSDFQLIRDYATWVYTEHERARRFLETQVQAGDIVVTHHLPAEACVSPQYEGDPFNCFFLADMQHVMRERRPALWIHGHTHGSVDLVCEGTRVICNPFGYARREENRGFVEQLVVEV
jgi:Icc-related predicted phosphoesterase